MLQGLLLIRVGWIFLNLPPGNLCSYVLSTGAAMLSVVTSSLSYRRVSYGYCYPHDLSSLQKCCCHFSHYRNAEPCTNTRGGAVPGPAPTGKTDSTATNKRKKSLPGPGSTIWDEKIRRKKHSFISPLSLSLYEHTNLESRWPVSPVGPAAAPGSCVHNGEKRKVVHVDWQHISARQDWK